MQLRRGAPRTAHSNVATMAEEAVHNGMHAPHDSAMSVEPLDDATKVKQLEAEVRDLAERANNACTFTSKLAQSRRLHADSLLMLRAAMREY